MIYHTPGSTIAEHYEVASRPIIGGMGIVYVCMDRKTDQPVVLKTFKPEFLPDRAARERFLREGTSWVELGSHPHIVRCYRIEYFDPTAFLVLELIDKEPDRNDASLRSWMDTPLQANQALLFALQIARGMKHATEKIPGFVHRDLKPENILVGADKFPGTNINRLRVTDFGLATILKDISGSLKDEEDWQSIEHTHLTHSVIGTPLYMAPEQWKRAALGIYTDVYAFGCILYEMLTGQRAATGRNIRDLREAHCAGRLCSLPKDIPVKIEQFITHCLALSPINRFQSWSDVTLELEQAYFTLTGQVIPDQINVGQAIHKERIQLGWSYNAIGTAYEQIGKPEIALRCFRKVSTIGKDQNDLELQAVALSHQGVVYRDLGDFKMAAQCLMESLAIDQKKDNQGRKAMTLGNLGLVFSDQGNAKKAILYHEEALEIHRKIGNQHGMGADLNNLGENYRTIGNLENAIRCFEESLMLQVKINNRRGIATVLDNLGLAYADLGDLRKALEFYKKSLALSREIGDRKEEGIVLGNMGVAFGLLSEMEQAIIYHQESLNISREINDPQGISEAFFGLGNIYAKLHKHYESIELYKQALVIRRESGNLYGVATVLYNMALQYLEINDAPRALSLAQEAAQIFSNIGNPYTLGVQQLIAKLEGNVSAQEANLIQAMEAAFTAFLQANTPYAMQIAITQNFLLAEPKFIQFIEDTIRTKVPPAQMRTYEERLAWLRKIVG